MLQLGGDIKKLVRYFQYSRHIGDGTVCTVMQFVYHAIDDTVISFVAPGFSVRDIVYPNVFKHLNASFSKGRGVGYQDRELGMPEECPYHLKFEFAESHGDHVRLQVPCGYLVTMPMFFTTTGEGVFHTKIIDWSCDVQSVPVDLYTQDKVNDRWEKSIFSGALPVDVEHTECLIDGYKPTYRMQRESLGNDICYKI